MSELVPDAVHRRAQAAYVAPTPEQLLAASDIVGRFAQCWNRPSADDLGDLMHADTRNQIPPMREPADRDAVVEHFRTVLRQLPDLRVEVARWAPTGDAVMIEWIASATVAGKPLTWSGVDRFNVRGERMYEAMVYWDTRGLAERMAAAIAQSGAAA